MGLFGYENGGGGRRIYLCALLFVCLVFVGAVKSWAQDLGALARQEQARKQALPNHPVHVYTNDDLARDKILLSEDSALFQSARKNLPPALELEPPAPAPQSVAVEPAPEPETREVSLGEVAKKYREEKLARPEPSPETAPVAVSIYVYTNDDMARPKILTPEDHAKYEAALKKPLPLPVGRKVEIEPAPTIESPAPEALVSEAPRPEVPLGDVARTVYQEEHPPQQVLVARRTPRSRFPWARTLVAYRTTRLPNFPARYTPVANVPVKRLVDPPSMKANDRGSGYGNDRELVSITVRSGDSLWKLARRHLGHGNQWRKLLAANPWIGNPNRLRVGAQIRI